MKIRNLLSAALAVLAFAACEQKQDFGPAKVELKSESTLAISAEGGTVTLEFIATVDWELQGYTSAVSAWLDASAVSGKPSAGVQKIVFKALDNSKADRKADLAIFGNVLTKAQFTVSQKGSLIEDGTLAHPYMPATAARMYTEGTLTNSNKVYIGGIINEFQKFPSTYDSVDAFISADGSDEGRLLVYHGKNFGEGKFTGTELKIGDEVIFYGKMGEYNGSPQVAAGAVLVSLNGQVDPDHEEQTPDSGTPDFSNTASKTVNEFIAAADKNNYFKLSGTVSGFNSQYCSFTLTDDTGNIVVWSVENKDDWSSKIKNDGKVVVAGKYDYYEDDEDASKNKHEVVDAYILSFEAVNVDYNAAPSKTVAEFIAAASETTYYKVTGTISNVVATSGHFDLTDGTGTVYCYQVTNKDDYKDRLSANDKVTIVGKYKKYEEKHELVDGYILSLEDGQAAEIELAHSLTSSVEWTLGEKAYNHKAKVNGTEYDALKLGTGNVIGNATIAIPESATKLSFYATGWNGSDGELEIYNGDTKIKTLTLKKNSAASGSTGVYTYEVLTDADNYFTVDISSVTSLKVQTTNAGLRAILFGINAE